MQHMKWIRDNYHVPAKRGARISYDDDISKFIRGFLWKRKTGTIVAARGGYIRVRFDHENYITTLHPTWRVKYL